MEAIVVYLVPTGRERFELYTEPPSIQEGAEAGHPGWFARLRTRATRVALATVGDHRMLWALAKADRATFVHPGDVPPAEASAIRDRLLARAVTHHLWRMAIAGTLLVPAAILTIVPGPNVIGYYLAARGIGHFFSWRGARRGAAVEWVSRAEPALAELRGLADLPRDTRAAHVDAIARRLRLPSLSAFFDRAAVPARS